MEHAALHADRAPRRTSMLDVRRGIRPVHSENREWVVAFSVSPFALTLICFELTSFFPICAVNASV